MFLYESKPQGFSTQFLDLNFIKTLYVGDSEKFIGLWYKNVGFIFAILISSNVLKLKDFPWNRKKIWAGYGTIAAIVIS